MKNLKKIELLCFVLASVLGVFFHFVYDWSGKNFLVGLFFPKNESTWEHLKLIFFPIVLVSVFEYFCLNVKTKNYIGVKFISAILGMLLTVLLFYTYQGVLGYTIDAVNIGIYFVAMFFAYLFSYHALSRLSLLPFSESVYYILFWCIGLLFVYFSIFPPDIGLFQSPK